jgi:hypothetical protein
MSANVMALLENWGKAYLHFFVNSPGRIADQHAFRRVIWESAAAFYVLPPEYNCRLQFNMRLVGAAKILHGRTVDYVAVAKKLNAEKGARVFARVLAGPGQYDLVGFGDVGFGDPSREQSAGAVTTSAEAGRHGTASLPV